MKIAACVLIKNEKGKILGISRRADNNDWGIPGGRVQYGESSEQAVSREIKEQTGISIKPENLVFLFNDFCPSAEEPRAFVTTYFAKEWSGRISQGVNGKVSWIDPKLLFGGTFSDYNQKMLSKLSVFEEQSETVEATTATTAEATVGIKETPGEAQLDN